MKATDYIVDYFDKQGVTIIFGYIGGMITHLVDSIAQHPTMQFVQTYHEQTAAIAAEGYAKERANLGVAISTSGPGATNMITGIADAYFDSIPVVFITGQVNTTEYKYNKKIRQQGFQETDVVTLVQSITNYATLVDQADQLKYELDKAVFMAKNGRPGPVLLDIPMDIQRAEIDPTQLRSFEGVAETFKTTEIPTVLALISAAKRPLILVGAGCKFPDATAVLAQFIVKTRFPVVTSLMGKGAVDESNPTYMGMIGSYGNRCANMTIANSDLVIVLGSRLDTRQTGAMIESFVRKGTIVHVDIDPDELTNNRLTNRIKIQLDVRSFLQQLIDSTIQPPPLTEWIDYVIRLKNRYDQKAEIARFVENKAPYKMIQVLNQYSQEHAIFCADVGQNQMWAAQTIVLKKGQKFVTSGGLAPMGFSLPAAVGTAFANPSKEIFSINGDGGFHIAVQSLMLISQYNLPIKVLVLNNNALGMITQFQELYFNKRLTGTCLAGGYCVPNIKSMAASYRLNYYLLTENELDNNELLSDIFSQRNCIIEYQIEGLTVVSPKLEYNRPIEQPMPLLSVDELNANMFID